MGAEGLLKTCIGKLASFSYERPKSNRERTIERIEITGIITKFEEDFKGAKYGNSIYIKSSGEERRYFIRRINNLEIL